MLGVLVGTVGVVVGVMVGILGVIVGVMVGFVVVVVGVVGFIVGVMVGIVGVVVGVMVGIVGVMVGIVDVVVWVMVWIVGVVIGGVGRDWGCRSGGYGRVEVMEMCLVMVMVIRTTPHLTHLSLQLFRWSCWILVIRNIAHPLSIIICSK